MSLSAADEQSFRSAAKLQLGRRYELLRTCLLAIGESGKRLALIGQAVEAEGGLKPWQKAAYRDHRTKVCSAAASVLELLQTDLVQQLMDSTPDKRFGGIGGGPMVEAVRRLRAYAEAFPHVEPGSSRPRLDDATHVQFNAVRLE